METVPAFSGQDIFNFAITLLDITFSEQPVSVNVEHLVLFMKTFSIAFYKLLGTPAVTPGRNGR